MYQRLSFWSIHWFLTDLSSLITNFILNTELPETESGWLWIEKMKGEIKCPQPRNQTHFFKRLARGAAFVLTGFVTFWFNVPFCNCVNTWHWLTFQLWWMLLNVKYLKTMANGKPWFYIIQINSFKQNVGHIKPFS